MMMRSSYQALLAATLLLTCVGVVPAQETTLSLAGTWQFRLDPDDVGVKEKWYAQELQDRVQLPGTTDENHKGIKKDERAIDRLSRVWFWKGPAWYQTHVTIPQAWAGKRITLLLERTKHTRVWVDQTFCGWDDTLSAPQMYDVTQALTPGKHMITVVVDNAKLPPIGPAHAVDERTQTNWNGIVGKMELRATDAVWLKDIQVYPNAAKKEARVRAVIGNITGKAFAGQVTVACQSINVDNPLLFKTQTLDVKGDGRETLCELTYQPGEEVPLWSEFQPAMLRMSLDLNTKAGDQEFSDQRAVNFGMRDFTRKR
ncbi:MAG: beta-galactosidase, partial [Phycisphaeraceae bacterium]|nr:beta-galactosidase [Phycisphaeraceae bacterium]